jgi:hypothetical protein
VAELNHVVHGKRSEKLSDDDRQLAFEDLETAVAEVETRKAQATPSTRTPRTIRQRNLGHLPADLPRIERVIEPASLECPWVRPHAPDRRGSDRAVGHRARAASGAGRHPAEVCLPHLLGWGAPHPG